MSKVMSDVERKVEKGTEIEIRYSVVNPRELCRDVDHNPFRNDISI